jgi:general secretion pathway protein G
MIGRKGLSLTIGITIFAMMLAISISAYKSSVLKSKETVLKDNLFEMRRVIKQYIKDKQQAPHSLQDLIQAGYFRQLPIDPVTNSNLSWKPVNDTVTVSAGKTDYGIADVHSGASSTSSKGTAYSSW